MAETITIEGVAISQDVLAQIIAQAASGVEGVAYVNGQNIASALASFFVQRNTNLEERVSVSVDSAGTFTATVPIAAFFGYPFQEIGRNLRQAVAQVLLRQIGIEDPIINVKINELVFPKE